MEQSTGQFSMPSKDRGLVDALLAKGLEPLFRRPELLDKASAWFGHAPFAQWLMQAHKPQVFVELGTHAGVSYSAFCAAALWANLDIKCFAVDTWQGDSQAGRYPESVFKDFQQFHDANYASFSTLLPMTFDQACGRFEDGSVDLLHIDGFHSYEAVRHDFETWLPKLSNRGVVLFHDTNEKREGFGVWRFWSEISTKYPSFQWLHNHGLGVLLVGEDMPGQLVQLCRCSVSETETLQERMEFLGARWDTQAAVIRVISQLRQLESDFEHLRADGEANSQTLRQRLDQATIARDSAQSKVRALLGERAQLATSVSTLRRQVKETAQASRAAVPTGLQVQAREADARRQIDDVQRQLEDARRQVEDGRRQVEVLSQELKGRDDRISDLLRSSSWRLTGPFRRLVRALRRLG